MKQCKSQIKYSTGKAPPKDGNEDAWMNSVISSPEPLTITLESLGSLGPLKKYLENKPEVMSNIKKVIQDYCKELKSVAISTLFISNSIACTTQYKNQCTNCKCTVVGLES